MSHYITCGRCGGTIFGDSGQCSGGDKRCECRHELSELTFEAGKTDGYHPNLDGPAEPVGLNMSEPTQLRTNSELRLRTLCETDVLPVLDGMIAQGCSHQWRWNDERNTQVWTDKPCGECRNCRAAQAAEKLRKELQK